MDAPVLPPAPLTPAQSPPRRATISYANDQLTVSASNSSLNQILREVSRLTGIKITGGVAEERVFGDYGPAQPSIVLGQLLDGTGSNMFLVAGNGGDKPSELILTPRTGGATPPNPNASRFDDGADDDASRPTINPLPATSESQNQPAREGSATAPTSTPTPTTAVTSSDPGTPSQAPTTQPADPNQQQSPNGVKTPQQIYDELMRLRRQQQSQPQ
jgi:hypothetical protein